MNKPLVTIFTPAYNVENYIIACIESVRNQTYDEFEWILVDNGSTDNTKNIIREYAKKDNRIKPVRFEKNTDGFAQDMIASFGRGTYVAKLDSDDFWDSRYLEKLVHAMETNGADLACCKAIVLDEVNNKRYYYGFREYEGAVTAENIAKQFKEIRSDLDTYWAKLMKRDLFLKASDSYNELCGENRKSGYAGDTIFMYCYLMECHKSVFIKDGLYFYRLYGKNASKTVIDTHILDKCLIYLKVQKQYLQKIHIWNTEYADMIYKTFWESLDKIFRNMIQTDTLGKKQKIEAISQILSDERVKELRKEYGDSQIRKLLSAHIAWCYVNLEEDCGEALWNMLEVLDPEMFSEITEEQRHLLMSDKERIALFILGDKNAQ